MRDQIILRDQTKEIKTAELLREKNILDAKNRILSLPSLCDTLRSKCLMDNRTCLKISELLRLLVSELFLTRSELSQRLDILKSIIPEFLTVVPADNILPVCTVRLNLQTPYSVVRKKVMAYVLKASHAM